ncbi:MAG: hypothetical protein LC798_03970 [Chloroflexi bacterium]|nr:hypothetical protein [Chloroflexota bacterium]
MILATATTGHAIARTLGRLGVSAYGIYPTRSAVTRSRYWRGIRILDLSAFPTSASAASLTRFGRSLPGSPQLITTTDDQARFVADHADLLGETFTFPRVSSELIATLTNKRLLSELCSRLKVPTPSSYFPADSEELQRLVETVRLPIILKGTEDRAAFRYTKAVARTRRRLAEICLTIEVRDYPGLMLQEYVPAGTTGSRWLFNGYFDASHRCLFGLTAIKVRENPISGGVASLAECRWNPRLAAEAIAFLEKIEYGGPVDMDYCHDEATDEYKLLDVNPRLGATFRALVDDRGWDVARAMFADQNGVPVDTGRSLARRRWLAEHADVVASVRNAQAGQLRLRSWLWSLIEVRELAWFSRDDLRPLLDLARYAVTKLRRPRAAWRGYSRYRD